MWKAAGISGLPGHRSVGGYRASMYNALPIESVQVLVDVMKALESKQFKILLNDLGFELSIYNHSLH
jgi:phosphoserine aminotransferase